jgi:hypothetical protein
MGERRTSLHLVPLSWPELAFEINRVFLSDESEVLVPKGSRDFVVHCDVMYVVYCEC